MHTEYIDMITREDDSIVEDGILAAIDLAKSYLGRYDLTKLFGVEPATAPTITSAALKRAVKNMAVFTIATLSTANYDMTVLNTLNDNALRWLRDIQKGGAIPDGWVLRDTSEDSYPDGDQVSGYFNDKKDNLI